MRQFLLFIGLFVFTQTGRSQTSYTWNGTISTSWSTPGNWTPNGVPGAVDNVTIVTGSNTCVLNAATSVTNFKITSGTLDMGGSTLTVNGATVQFSAGTVQNGDMAVTGATATTLGNGPMTMNCNVTITSAAVTLRNTTFQDSTTITQTGATNEASLGNNVFNGVTTITDAGAGYLALGNTSPDQFNSTTTFNNTGSNSLYVANNSTNNVFGGVTTFNNSPSANFGIYVSQSSTGTIFSNNIVVNSTGGTGVQFCTGNTTATATLSAGYTISVGAGGFSAGILLLRQFTQTGATAQNLTLTGTGELAFGPSSSFGGTVTSVSPALLFNGCTFAGAVTCTKNGGTNDASIGNNVFNGATTMTNAGTGYLQLGNGNPDHFNSTATFNNLGTGSNSLYVANNSTGNVFGGVTTFNNTPTGNNSIYVSANSTGTTFANNIVVTSNNGNGVQFCTGNTTATATLSAGYTISVGAGGFSAGTLLLKQFTQTGATAQSLTLTGAGILTFGPSSSFGGNVTSSSPDLFFNGCTFSNTATCTKTGTTSEGSVGNNVFNGVTTITNAGAGYLALGTSSPDQFNSTTTFNNTGSNSLYVANNSTNNVFGGVTTFNNSPSANFGIYVSQYSTGTVFNGNIVVNSTSGIGVQFCGGNTTATATLSAGNTISVGGTGFSAGILSLRQFTQTGATAQSLTLTGAGILVFGPSAAIGGNITVVSPDLLFNGCNFSGIVNCTKTGTINDQSLGNNTFNGSSTFTNNGTGSLMMTLNTADAYNGNTTFVQNGTGAVAPNYNNNSTYAGNVTVTSPAGTAITFGANTGTATFSGSALQTINATAGSAIPVFANLVIANTGSGVTLNNTSINVSKNLTLTSGLINTSATYILTMLNGSAVAAGTALSTSYVNGPMQYQKSSAGTSILNFPIGTSPDCRPVVLTVDHTSTSPYTYQAQLFDASASALGYLQPPTVDAVSAVHYYTITRTDASGVTQPTLGLSGNQTIQLFFGQDDLVTNGSTLTIVKNTALNPTAWINIGGTGGPAYNGGADLTGSVTSTSSPTAFNSFSTFALADQIGGGNVLPIGLLYFDAKPDKSQVDLTWATATESKNSYFTVERSKDGVNFWDLENVKTEALNGNGSLTLYYMAYDLDPYAGGSFYRLKQTDLDGNSTYSGIVPVNFDNNRVVSVYPNPTAGTIYISGLGVDQNSLIVDWFDMSGRLLLQQNASVEGGIAKLGVAFRNGVYFLQFRAGDGTIKAQNVIVLK